MAENSASSDNGSSKIGAGAVGIAVGGFGGVAAASAASLAGRPPCSSSLARLGPLVWGYPPVVVVLAVGIPPTLPYLFPPSWVPAQERTVLAPQPPRHHHRRRRRRHHPGARSHRRTRRGLSTVPNFIDWSGPGTRGRLCECKGCAAPERVRPMPGLVGLPNARVGQYFA